MGGFASKAKFQQSMKLNSQTLMMSATKLIHNSKKDVYRTKTEYSPQLSGAQK